MSRISLYFPKTKPDDSPYDASVLAPLSLLAVSGPLRGLYDVKIFDSRVEPEGDEKLLEHAGEAVCVGISCMTGYQIADGLRLARLVRQGHPDVPIVWGGYHPSLLPGQTAEHPLVDFVIRGQGETTFAELAGILAKARADRVSLADLKAGLEPPAGVSFARTEKEVVHGPGRPLEDVNAFPPLPYDMVDLEKYIHENRGLRAINYVSSAGCLFQCGFCANVEVYGRRWTGLSPERVVVDLERLVRDYRIGLVYMDDNNFFVDLERARQVCQGLVDRNLRLKWYAAGRAEHISHFDREMLQLLRESGFAKAMIGAESGSDRVLKMINKGSDVEDVLSCTRVCRDAGIQPSYAYIYGFPCREKSEHHEEVEATLALTKRVQQIDPNAKITTLFFTPYPGTALGRLGESYGETMPERLEEWVDFDPRGERTPWIDAKEKKRLLLASERIISFAYPSDGLRKAMRRHRFGWVLFGLHRLAYWRARHGWYGLPLEWKAMEWYRGRKRPESPEGTVQG
jgi:anaerobic magnesium-protoporphyrin IX monomethyl ester cyclase